MLLLGGGVANAQTAGEAKAHRTAAEAAVKAKDWAKALTEFQAANAAEKSAESAEGVADAQWELGHVPEAYEAYEDFLNTYSAKLSKPKKAAAEKRLKELAEKTGAFTLDVTEAGAEVFVDDKSLGKSPLGKPVRVLSGPHRVRVAKEGFLPWEQAPNAVAQATTPVAVKLEIDARKAKLSVREQGNQQVHVFIDGVDMGAAPWSGDVEPGEHEVLVKSGTMLAAPQKVSVAKGDARDVVLVASATTATLKISTADGKGVIYIDGKVAGEGVFSGDIPAGMHKLTVKRDGYDPFEEDLTLKEKETVSRSVTMQLVSAVTTGTAKAEDRLEGMYLGLGLVGALMPTGNGSDIQNNCASKPPGMNIASCKDSTDLGAGLNVYAGYHWDPVGMELSIQALYDQVTPETTFNASSVNLNADPARTEKYAIRRAGGAAALRARYTFQRPKYRLGFAAGPGLAYRQLFFQRDATADLNGGTYTDKYIGSTGYFAPALSLDAHVGWRVTRAFELQLGFQTLFESPRVFGDQVQLQGDNGRQLSTSGSSTPLPAGAITPPNIPGVTYPITTPTYQLVTGTQTFIGAYLGVQFGP